MKENMSHKRILFTFFFHRKNKEYIKEIFHYPVKRNALWSKAKLGQRISSLDKIFECSEDVEMVLLSLILSKSMGW